MTENKKLDLKDKKILSYIDFNARASYQEIGKFVGLSKQGVEHRIKSLIENKIILGFYPLINIQNLDYLYFRIFITLKNADQKIKEEIVEEIQSNNKYFWAFHSQGKYDILLGISTQTISEYNLIIEEFMLKFGKYADKKDENIATEVYAYENRYLIGKNETKEIVMKNYNTESKLDEIDIKILEELCKNSRLSLVEIGNQIGESAKVVSYRMKKMERNKIILAYRPVINYKILGFTYYKVLIDINYTSKEELDKLINKVKQNPILIYMVKGFNLQKALDIEIIVKDNIELYDFINNLKDEFPNLIGSYETIDFTDTIKTRFLPF